MKLFKVIRTTARGVKFATRVGITVGSNMLQGVANVADVAGRAARKTARGDWDGLERLAERTARGVGRSIENKCTAAGELFSEAERCIANPDRRFLTKKNAARVAAVATGASQTWTSTDFPMPTVRAVRLHRASRLRICRLRTASSRATVRNSTA